MNTFKSSLVVALFFLSVTFVAYGAYLGITKVFYNSSDDPQSIVLEVNKIAAPPLPTDEVPTVVTVANLEPLKTQPIFRNARVGDILLIYTKNKRAILYRQEENRIISDANLID